MSFSSPSVSSAPSVVHWLRRRLRPCSAFDYTRLLIQGRGIKTALDIGAGSHSMLSQFRPAGLHLTAIEPDELSALRLEGFVDRLISKRWHDALEDLGGECFDLITLYGVIEHMDKPGGNALLDSIERASSKYILIETPNGFVYQGPEFGNPLQRHRSGWFVEDFLGRGYSVFGTTGTRWGRGYMARARIPIFMEELLTLVLRINRHPRLAFNLVAIKNLEDYGNDPVL